MGGIIGFEFFGEMIGFEFFGGIIGLELFHFGAATERFLQRPSFIWGALRINIFVLAIEAFEVIFMSGTGSIHFYKLHTSHC